MSSRGGKRSYDTERQHRDSEYRIGIETNNARHRFTQLGVDFNLRATSTLMICCLSSALVCSWFSASVSSTMELFVSPMSGVARPGGAAGSTKYICCRKPGVPNIEGVPLTCQIITQSTDPL